MATLREQVEELKKQNAELEKMYRNDVAELERQRDEARARVAELENRPPASVGVNMRHV